MRQRPLRDSFVRNGEKMKKYILLVTFLLASCGFNSSEEGSQEVAGKYELKKGFSNKEIINSLRFKNIPIKITFNNMERIENLASRVSKFIEADSLSLMNSFNNEVFLENNNLNTESVFSIFLPNTYEFYWNTSADEFRNKMHRIKNKIT